MESHERGRPGTDVEQDLGEPGASGEAADSATPSIGSGAFGVGASRTGEEAATDVEQDVGYPNDAYTSGTPATDPTQR